MDDNRFFVLRYADSLSTIELFSTPLVRSKLVRKHRAVPIATCKRNIVTLLWVPDHADITGNEKTNDLVRAGMK